MPVASTVAAVGGAVAGGLAKGAVGALTKKGGGGAAAPQFDFSGLMASNNAAFKSPEPMNNRVVAGENNNIEKWLKDTPALELLKKVDNIFVPEIKGVE